MVGLHSSQRRAGVHSRSTGGGAEGLEGLVEDAAALLLAHIWGRRCPHGRKNRRACGLRLSGPVAEGTWGLSAGRKSLSCSSLAAPPAP
eukprot:768074-Hanusia_phi.AAC.8